MRSDGQFEALPPTAAWAHRDARNGFEVVFFAPAAGGHLITGSTTAVEDDTSWIVRYQIELDSGWHTRRAHVIGCSATGRRSARLASDGHGHWQINDAPAPHLDGCLDLDLESSAATNAVPVHRLGLARGVRSSTPAVYIRAADLTVGRLDQSYERIADDDDRQRYQYIAPAFQFTSTLTYDLSGLVLTYPGIAQRIL